MVTDQMLSFDRVCASSTILETRRPYITLNFHAGYKICVKYLGQSTMQTYSMVIL